MSSDPGPGSGPSSPVLGGQVERATYRALLGERSFRSLFIAMFTSSMGDWIGLFAILALTEQLLGATRAGAFALSAIMVARVVPTLVLGPVAGVFVDRWDRKRTMIFTDIGRGVVMIFVALAGDIFQLIFATLAIEVLSTLFIPAKDATLPNLVRKERLVHANQLSLLVTYGTLPLGAALFAVLVGLSNTFLGGIEFVQDRPVAVPIWINALSFLVSAAFILGIRVPPNGRAHRAGDAHQPGAWADLKEGFQFIASHAVVRALVVGVMGAFMAAGVVIGVGKLFATVVNAGESGFGVLGFAVGAGLFTGIAASSRITARVDKERVFAPGILVAGVGLIATALMPTLTLAAVFAFTMGAGGGLAFITGYTLLQENTTDAVRGRTFAAFNTGVRAALFASLIVGPILVGLIGPEQAGPDRIYGYVIGGVRGTLILAGGVALVGAVWTQRSVSRYLVRRDSLSLEIPVLKGGLGRRGLFVVFEGGEGAGKSTQLELLRRAIEQAGHDAIVTREPGGTDVGEALRRILLDPAAQISGRTETLLYAAARSQHADEVIRPALEKGLVVLSDRYVDSSVVYQGLVRGLGDVQVEELNRWGTADLQPDLVILLDVDAREGLRRVGDDPDRLEAEGVDFHRRVNEGFRRRAAVAPGRYLVVDATLPADDIHVRVRDAVLARLESM